MSARCDSACTTGIHGGSRRTDVVLTVLVALILPQVSFRRRHRAVAVYTEASQDVLSTRWRATSRQPRRSSRKIPRWTRSCRPSAPAAWRHPQQRPHDRALEAPQPAPAGAAGRAAASPAALGHSRPSGLSQQPPPIRIGGLQTKALYQFSLFGSDLAELYVWPRRGGEFRALPQLVDVNTISRSPVLRCG